MFDLDKWTEIWVTITQNKTRSLLTCFGVFWGILMLVILLGAGTGMKNGILSAAKGFATNSAIFFPEKTSKPYRGFNKDRSWDIHLRDVEAVRRQVKGYDALSAMLFGESGSKNIVNGQLSVDGRIKAVEPDYFKIETEHVIFGRLLNDIDIKDKRKVCLLGQKLNDVLFRSGDPCGKYVRVNGIYYQVVGVVKQIATNVVIGGRAENSVMLPLSTYQQTNNQGDIIHGLAVSAAKGNKIDPIVKNIESVLKVQNEIAPDDPKAVATLNISEMFATFDKLFDGIDILVWLVGMGTLLAGIIGVSNIMMVTVRERTNEIGVRRALGAKPKDIISQIMAESLTLTALAGLLGLSCGVYLLDLINKLLSANPSEDQMIVDPSVNIQTAIAATIVLLISGLLAGLIPAWRAMQIKAIDAIREE